MDCEKRQHCTPCADKKYAIYDNLEGMPLGMAYVPWQQWQNVMDGHRGLEHGSIFEELILPFYGVKAACCAKSNNGNADGRRCNRL